MRLLVLSASDVHALLGHRDCAEAMREALLALASGMAQQPLRTVIQPDGAAGLMALMPSFLAAASAPQVSAPPDRPTADSAPGGGAPGDGAPGDGADSAVYGLKAICITPANPAAGLDTHQGIVLLSDGRTGEPLALLNASAVTEIRTAAVSVVATQLLANPDAATLAVIGTGVQARAHIAALDTARQLSQIRVAGRNAERAADFAASLRGQTKAPVRSCASAAEAVAGADLIVTATSSAVTVLDRDWIAPGAHINAVGACLPHQRELDTATMAAGVLFADRRESVLAESGDYVLAAADGAVTPASIRAELGEVLTGTATGRASRAEITIFESLGLAVEDLAAAACTYSAALASAPTSSAAGTWVSF